MRKFTLSSDEIGYPFTIEVQHYHLMLVTWVFPLLLAVLFAALFPGKRTVYRLLMFLLPLQSLAVVIIPSVGFGLQPAYTVAPVISSLIIYRFSQSGKVSIHKALLLPGVFFCLYLIFSWVWGVHLVSEVPNKFAQQSTNRFGQLLYWLSAIGFLLNAYFFTRWGNYEQIRRDWNWLGVGAVLVSVIGLYQLLAHYAGLWYPYEYIYNNPTFAMHATTNIVGFLRLTSTFPEPSMFSIFGGFSLGILYGLRRTWLLGLVSFALLLTLSSTGILALTIFCGLVLLHRTSLRQFMQFSVPFGALGGFSLLFPPVRNVLYVLTVGKVQTHSADVRWSFFVSAISSWWEHPLLGWGLGVGRPKDGLSFLLINMGLIGLVLFFLFIRHSLFSILRPDDRFQTGLTISFIILTMAHLVAVPDWTMPYLWVLAGTIWGLHDSELENPVNRRWSLKGRESTKYP